MRTVVCGSFFWVQPAVHKKKSKTLLFPGNLWNSIYVLCQKGPQPSCEEEDGQNYILMTSPCIWESRAHLASRGCLSWRIMLFQLTWILLYRGLYLLKARREQLGKNVMIIHKDSLKTVFSGLILPQWVWLLDPCFVLIQMVSASEWIIWTEALSFWKTTISLGKQKNRAKI